MKPKDMVRDLVDQNRVFVKQVVVTLYDQDSDKRREVRTPCTNTHTHTEPSATRMLTFLSSVFYFFLVVVFPQVCLFVFNDQLLVTKGDIKKDRFQIIAKFTRDDINFRLEIMADTDGSVPVRHVCRVVYVTLSCCVLLQLTWVALCRLHGTTDKERLRAAHATSVLSLLLHLGRGAQPSLRADKVHLQMIDSSSSSPPATRHQRYEIKSK
jgi:hypothetical protein